MKKTIIYLLLCFCYLESSGQVKFSDIVLREDVAFLNKIDGNFGGLSGIEYRSDTGTWIFVSDQGNYFKFRDIEVASDFKLRNLVSVGSTSNSFESIRYYPDSSAYFFSVETSDFTGVYFSRDEVGFGNPTEILRVNPLPVDNKGIEAIAITPSGTLWVAPEAGWRGEIHMTQNYAHFYRYTNPFKIGSKPELFKYPIRRFPAAAVNEDRFGGISEILAVDDTHLLVLERCYFKSSRDQVIAFLRNVTVDEESRMLVLEDEDAFDLNSIPNLCNIEGMTWGDPDKRSLVLIGDDGLGATFYSDLRNLQTGMLLKPTLRNQLIILRKK